MTSGWTLGAQSGSMCLPEVGVAEPADRRRREGAADGDDGGAEDGEPEDEEESHGTEVCGLRERRGG
ncbi:MAG: hypothetical protein SangKO_099720 [Sandaracinaceae bacterium]